MLIRYFQMVSTFHPTIHVHLNSPFETSIADVLSHVICLTNTASTDAHRHLPGVIVSLQELLILTYKVAKAQTSMSTCARTIHPQYLHRLQSPLYTSSESSTVSTWFDVHFCTENHSLYHYLYPWTICLGVDRINWKYFLGHFRIPSTPQRSIMRYLYISIPKSSKWSILTWYHEPKENMWNNSSSTANETSGMVEMTRFKESYIWHQNGCRFHLLND